MGKFKAGLMRKGGESTWISAFGKFTQSLTQWTGCLALFANVSGLPVLAAETIAIEYGSLKAVVAVDDVGRFVATGELTGELAGYGSFLSPGQRSRLRRALQLKIDLNATLVSQLVYSPVGDVVLGRLDRLINAGDVTGGNELKAAVVEAAAAPEGLTLLSVFKQFPTSEVRVNAGLALDLLEAASQQIENKQKFVTLVEAQAIEQSNASTVPEAWAEADLSQAGPQAWRRIPFDWADASRMSRSGEMLGRIVPTDLYLPKVDGAIPVVIISHGMASDRQTLAYLAEHLASHGIVVAVPEHIGSNGTKFQRYFDGVAAPPEPREALDRPLDVTFILDQLAELPLDEGQMPRLLVERTVVIGQSFGGYTALAVGGAELNVAALQKSCGAEDPQDLLNMSLLLQCQLVALDRLPAELRDERVAAVMAVNPFASRVFGQEGMAAVEVPVMMVSGSADLVVPSVEEQFYPFTWLPKGEHSLALIRNGTHFSVLEEPAEDEKSLPIASSFLGNHGEVAQGYLSSLSLAFVRRHSIGDESAREYLMPAYGQHLSQPEMPLSIVRSLNLK